MLVVVVSAVFSLNTPPPPPLHGKQDAPSDSTPLWRKGWPLDDANKVDLCNGAHDHLFDCSERCYKFEIV